VQSLLRRKSTFLGIGRATKRSYCDLLIKGLKAEKWIATLIAIGIAPEKRDSNYFDSPTIITIVPAIEITVAAIHLIISEQVLATNLNC
jgi:hypothetical protein